MFGEQLYPTPKPVIEQMVKGLKLGDSRVLDPSAGRGDILDYVIKATRVYGYNNRGTATTYAIEIDPDLRNVLSGKDHRVIDSDFLTYNDYQYFDFILMNPPFKDGVKHLLKAWDISKGAEIRCLLNASSLAYHPQNGNGKVQPSLFDQPIDESQLHTQDQKRLAYLIKTFGSVEYLGQVFKHSDHPTNVEVILVSLKDPCEDDEFLRDFDPERAGQEVFDLQDIADTELVTNDAFAAYEAHYRAAIESFKDVLRATQKARYYMDGLISDSRYSGDKILTEAIEKRSTRLAFEYFVEQATEQSWNTIFTKTKLGRITTKRVRDQIEKRQATQGKMAFTAANMNELFFTLALGMDQIMIDCVLEVFDELTKYHKENRVYVEGWATNSAYQVRRFILPNMGRTYFDNGIGYGAQRTLDDIEKALCFLNGMRFENITPLSQLYSRESHYHQWVVSTFFETKFFKKGTMHFVWRDEDLCDRFNAVVAKERWGWIPENIKTGVYK